LSWERSVSKKKAVDPVKASPLLPALDAAAFTARFAAAATRGGFRSELMGEVNGHPLLAYTRRSPGPRPRVYLSAGIHGDEPAPPGALLRLMVENFFDHRCTWFICAIITAPSTIPSKRHRHCRWNSGWPHTAPC